MRLFPLHNRPVLSLVSNVCTFLVAGGRCDHLEGIARVAGDAIVELQAVFEIMSSTAHAEFSLAHFALGLSHLGCFFRSR